VVLGPRYDRSVSLDPGASIDRYVVESFAGSGAMADVYRIRHVALGTRHALKIMRHGSPRERFQREGRNQAVVRHPNVVGVSDAFMCDGRPALVVEWVEGPTLAELIARGEKVDPSAIVRGIAAGLAAIHSHGLVHRDLKPANILMAGATPRIADFGLAKLLDDPDDPVHTRAGALVGTPAYMAPEQTWDASTVDARADLWALGVVVYELLTGVRPFAGTTLPQLIHAVRSGTWTRVPGLAAPWAGLLDRCLVVEPDHRIAAADAVLALLDDDPAATLPPPTLDLPAPSRGNVAAPRTSFIGRDAELAAIHSRFASGGRLVSILGPGGVGKTRLATAYALRRGPDHPGGAWFVDLTEAHSAGDVANAVADALGVTLVGNEPGTVQVGRALRARGRLLVVLDNFEQVVEAAPTTVARWLVDAPEAVFLVTTRERLLVTGEVGLHADALPTDDGVHLFDERARAADPSWRGDPGTIRAIVERVEGMPLAVELAAARVRVLPPAELLHRLDSGFAVLKGGQRGTAPRQASVAAAIEWSWGLLSAAEQRAFAQLSVFRGGFTVGAAEAVVDVPDVLDVVQALVDKSLVRLRADGRLGMYVAIAEFASAKLAEQGETPVLARYVGWWTRRGPELVDAARRGDDDEPLRALIAEEENLRRAFDIAVSRGDAGAATLFRTTEMLLWAWGGHGSARHRGFVTPELTMRLLETTADPALRREIRLTRLRRMVYLFSPGELDAELQAAEAEGATGPELEAELGMYRARRKARAGELEDALRLLERSEAAVERHCDSFELLRLHGWRATILGSQGRWSESVEDYARLLVRLRGERDRWCETLLLTNRAVHRFEAGDFVGAAEDARAGRDLAERMGLELWRDLNAGGLGSVAAASGRAEEAREVLQSVLRKQAASGNTRYAAAFAAELGWVEALLGDLAGAERAFAMATPEAMDELMEWDRVEAWRSLALWRAHRGDADAAARAIADAEALLAPPAPERAVFSALRRALGDRTDRPAVAAVLERDLRAVRLLDVVSRAREAGTEEARGEAIAEIAPFDSDGRPIPERAVARTALSLLARLPTTPRR